MLRLRGKVKSGLDDIFLGFSGGSRRTGCTRFGDERTRATLVEVETAGICVVFGGDVAPMGICAVVETSDSVIGDLPRSG
jgi:hypothetical protein